MQIIHAASIFRSRRTAAPDCRGGSAARSRPLRCAPCMTLEEVEKYITQVAFSGAADFLDKYENASGDGIIGHFGLGFYSAYMVSEKVVIYTKSYRDEPAVRWESDGNSTYKISETDKASRGTKIVMYIAEGEEEFLKEYRIRELLRKYCSYMPVLLVESAAERHRGLPPRPQGTTSASGRVQGQGFVCGRGEK